MTNLTRVLQDALAAGTLSLVVLSRPRGSGDKVARRVALRPATVGGELRYQESRRVGAQEFHTNRPAEEVAERVVSLFTAEFDQINVYTADADTEIRRKPDGTELTRRSRPTHKAVVGTAHDRARNHILPDGTVCPFLVATGVMTSGGRVRAPRRKKFRQINRYLEIVSDIVAHLPTGRPLRIIDFGCGRSYLTFALHHLFVTELKRPVRMTGLDLKADVIRDCQRLAEELQCEGLEFQQGDIAGYDQSEDVDLCVSLHACDTATDDALARAVAWNSEVILAVPCCQHELAAQLRSDDHAALLRHGIMRERFAALATDSLRARGLDVLGYRSQILEFIDTEHTPKNLMIRAVRKPAAEASVSEAASEYVSLRNLLGIDSFHLERLTSLSAHVANQ